MSADAARRPAVHAHRGGPFVDGVRTHPENSLEAISAAAAAGADAVELDVRLSRDRVPVVIHDPALDRTTMLTGDVHRRTAAALAAAGVPELEAALEHCGRLGLGVSLELKLLPGEPDAPRAPLLAQRVADLALADGATIPAARVLVLGFDAATTRAARAWAPDLATCLLGRDGGLPADGGWDGHAWLGPRWPVAADDVARAHEAGLRVLAWGVDGEDAVRGAAGAGVDALVTDDPALAVRILDAG